jgi:RNA polymerase sigma-70 factor, ECF subfamily
MAYVMEAGPRITSRTRRVDVRSVPGHDETDGDLLQQTAQGNREAFETLYGRYSRAVFGLALRRLGDREQAEDAVQDTFTSVWRSARSYRPERGPGGPWLYTVARNAIVDRARARRHDLGGDPPDVASTEPGPDERVEAGWQAFVVHRAFAELPSSERAVLELAYWSGLSQSEISDFLNVPLGTVKTRTRNGLARLADLLEEEDLR